MLGSMASQGGRSLIRLATTGMVLAGVGTAGLGVYGNQIQDPRVNTAQSFLQDHAREVIIVGVALVVLGGILNFVMAQRMQKRMMASMPMMSGAGFGGMPGMPGAGAMPGMSALMGASAEVIKVRCPSCRKPQAESATFCADCGKAMVPVVER